MQSLLKLLTASLLLTTSHFAFANITGAWRYIDDKTGEAKGIVKIEKLADGTYAGTAIKITPRAGYKAKEFCTNCPAPYTNKPIIGMQVISKLKTTDQIEYTDGQIIDPVSGKIYRLKAKLSPDGKKLILRGYIGISALGRSQTWLRVE